MAGTRLVSISSKEHIGGNTGKAVADHRGPSSVLWWWQALPRPAPRSVLKASSSLMEAQTGCPALKLVARAVRPLAVGEQVTFSYMDSPDDLLCPSSIRQRRLHHHKYFVCQCHRCLYAEGGDPCRGFRCKCGREARASQAKLDLNAARYAPAAATFLCACGQHALGSSLDAEKDCSSMLETLLGTLVDLTIQVGR